MSLFNKLKNMFYEEEEIESIPVPESKMNTTNMNEAEESHEFEKKDSIDKKEVKKDVDEILSERELLKTEPTFKFPVIFDDEDFTEKKDKKGINVLEHENNKYKSTEKTKVQKVESKKFKPSLAISPVYGILDKDYKKEENSSRDGLLSSVYDDEEKIDVDTIRKKAYGEVNTREEKFQTNIEEETDNTEDTELSLFVNTDVEETVETSYEEESYDLDEIDKKIKSIDDLLKETSDEDFYSLVDGMYKDEGDDE